MADKCTEVPGGDPISRKEAERKIAAFIEHHPQYSGKAKILLLTEFPFLRELEKEIRG